MTAKVSTRLRLLCLVIGLRDSRQFSTNQKLNQNQSHARTRDSARTLSELQVVGRYCDWFIALFAPVVIGRSSYCTLVLVLRQSFENRSIRHQRE